MKLSNVIVCDGVHAADPPDLVDSTLPGVINTGFVVGFVLIYIDEHTISVGPGIVKDSHNKTVIRHDATVQITVPSELNVWHHIHVLFDGTISLTKFMDETGINQPSRWIGMIPTNFDGIIPFFSFNQYTNFLMFHSSAQTVFQKDLPKTVKNTIDLMQFFPMERISRIQFGALHPNTRSQVKIQYDINGLSDVIFQSFNGAIKVDNGYPFSVAHPSFTVDCLVVPMRTIQVVLTTKCDLLYASMHLIR